MIRLPNKTLIFSYTIFFFSLISVVYAQDTSSGKAQVLWIGPTPTNFWKILAVFAIVSVMVMGVFLVEKQQKTKRSQNLELS